MDFVLCACFALVLFSKTRNACGHYWRICTLTCRVHSCIYFCCVLKHFENKCLSLQSIILNLDFLMLHCGLTTFSFVYKHYETAVRSSRRCHCPFKLKKKKNCFKMKSSEKQNLCGMKRNIHDVESTNEKY